MIATLSKGYDLDYVWKQVDPSLTTDPGSYYIRASEAGGEPPGRWGPGAQAFGFRSGETIQRIPYARHTTVSIMSSNGVPIQDISDTVGHKSTHVTETVYRHVIRPTIRGGATVMDNVFGDDGDD